MTALERAIDADVRAAAEEIAREVMLDLMLTFDGHQIYEAWIDRRVAERTDNHFPLREWSVEAVERKLAASGFNRALIGRNKWWTRLSQGDRHGT